MSDIRHETSAADVTGLILAGGTSRRFGADKALAHLDGRPFVTRIHAALAPLCAEVLIATGPTARRYPVAARAVLDDGPDGGPLAGLLAGLEAASTEWLLVVAVDLPFVTTDGLRALLAGAEPSVDAAVAVDSAGRRQPVCGLYRRQTSASARQWLADGRRALLPWVDTLVAREVPVPDAALRNVNRPADLDGPPR